MDGVLYLVYLPLTDGVCTMGAIVLDGRTPETSLRAEDVRRAPKGMLRVVYLDCMDGNWPCFDRDCSSVEEVKEYLRSLSLPHYQCTAVYDDQGELAVIDWSVQD